MLSQLTDLFSFTHFAKEREGGAGQASDHSDFGEVFRNLDESATLPESEGAAARSDSAPADMNLTSEQQAEPAIESDSAEAPPPAKDRENASASAGEPEREVAVPSESEDSPDTAPSPPLSGSGTFKTKHNASSDTEKRETSSGLVATKANQLQRTPPSERTQLPAKAALSTQSATTDQAPRAPLQNRDSGEVFMRRASNRATLSREGEPPLARETVTVSPQHVSRQFPQPQGFNAPATLRAGPIPTTPPPSDESPSPQPSSVAEVASTQPTTSDSRRASRTSVPTSHDSSHESPMTYRPQSAGGLPTPTSGSSEALLSRNLAPEPVKDKQTTGRLEQVATIAPGPTFQSSPLGESAAAPLSTEKPLLVEHPPVRTQPIGTVEQERPPGHGAPLPSFNSNEASEFSRVEFSSATAGTPAPKQSNAALEGVAVRSIAPGDPVYETHRSESTLFRRTTQLDTGDSAAQPVEGIRVTPQAPAPDRLEVPETEQTQTNGADGKRLATNQTQESLLPRAAAANHQANQLSPDISRPVQNRSAPSETHRPLVDTETPRPIRTAPAMSLPSADAPETSLLQRKVLSKNRALPPLIRAEGSAPPVAPLPQTQPVIPAPLPKQAEERGAQGESPAFFLRTESKPAESKAPHPQASFTRPVLVPDLASERPEGAAKANSVTQPPQEATSRPTTDVLNLAPSPSVAETGDVATASPKAEPRTATVGQMKHGNEQEGARPSAQKTSTPEGSLPEQPRSEFRRSSASNASQDLNGSVPEVETPARSSKLETARAKEAAEPVSAPSHAIPDRQNRVTTGTESAARADYSTTGEQLPRSTAQFIRSNQTPPQAQAPNSPHPSMPHDVAAYPPVVSGKPETIEQDIVLRIRPAGPRSAPARQSTEGPEKSEALQNSPLISNAAVAPIKESAPAQMSLPRANAVTTTAPAEGARPLVSAERSRIAFRSARPSGSTSQPETSPPGRIQRMVDHTTTPSLPSIATTSDNRPEQAIVNQPAAALTLFTPTVHRRPLSERTDRAEPQAAQTTELRRFTPARQPLEPKSQRGILSEPGRSESVSPAAPQPVSVLVPGFDPGPESLGDEFAELAVSETRSTPLGPTGQVSAQTARSEQAQAIARQIAEAIAARPSMQDDQIELKLSPEELGTIRFRMAQSDQGIVMHIAADRQETLDLMRRHVDQLARGLSEMGYDSASFSFGGNQSEERSGKAAAADAVQGENGTTEPGSPEARDPSGGIDIRV